ncbi:MAG: zinc metallopeptidase [Clostridia bacterium]|nr:zinc metallopeptidase [Clostridia bacterium]
MYYMDPTYLILIPGIILALVAQGMVKSAFNKYSRVPSRSGLTGARLARILLDKQGLNDIPVQRVAGNLTDNYNPSDRTLNLSQPVYDSSSVAALGVAAHECGHAMQHQEGYAPLAMRSAIVPVTQIGSNLSWPLFLIGLIASFRPLLVAGIVLFCFTVLFTLITLPVEFNASRRAIRVLEGDMILEGEEFAGARSVLRAAALTYVASALSAILNLLRLVALSGRGRRRN